MDKPLLLQRLSKIRAGAEAAHLEVVTHTARVTEVENRGRLKDEIWAQLNSSKMAEQKLLREMSWVLDQLDETEREK